MITKFFHEHLLNSDKNYFIFIKASIEIKDEFIPNSRIRKNTPISGLQKLDDEDVRFLSSIKNRVFKLYNLDPAQCGPAYDQCLADYSFHIYIIICDAILRNSRNVKSYLFSETFFPVLNRSNLDNISWGMLKKDIIATVRLPVFIRDNDNDHTNEFTFVIGPNKVFTDSHYNTIEEYPFDRSIFICSIMSSGQIMTFNYGIPNDNDLENKAIRKVLEKNHSKNVDFWISILKCIVYLSSGDPDLREQKNPIRYQSPTSKTPVKDHKNFSVLPYEIVGFGWEKEPNYTKDSWHVAPFLRFQPCGKGLQDIKCVLVKGHVRSRHDNIIGDNNEPTSSIS